MDELSDFNIHTVYHPGFSYVCLDPWDLQAAYIHVLSVSTATCSRHAKQKFIILVTS